MMDAMGMTLHIKGRQAVLAGSILAATIPAWALDLGKLWDFGDPARSEQNFLAALPAASADEALILRTQIARTHGLRRDFERQRQVLAEVAPHLATASAEARVRYQLELGRSYVSGTHTPEQLTDEARDRARRAYLEAIDTARTAALDGLQVDALHMMEFVEREPADKLRWTRQALDLATRSTQPAARAWRASLHHNIGYTLRQSGQLDAALAEFEQALAIRREGGNAESIRVGRWMVAWTLRGLGRLDEALAIQLALEKERTEAQRPSPYVHEELAELYRAKGDTEREQQQRALKRQLQPGG